MCITHKGDEYSPAWSQCPCSDLGMTWTLVSQCHHVVVFFYWASPGFNETRCLSWFSHQQLCEMNVPMDSCHELWCSHCLAINHPDNEAGEYRLQTLGSCRFSEDKPTRGLWNTLKLAVTKPLWKKYIIKNTPLERISFNLLHKTHH